MVYGTGVDIIEIRRVKEASDRNGRFLKRLFTPEELTYCCKRSDPWPCLAARFAAKEAVIKAFAGLGPFSWQEIEVRKDSTAPSIRLYGRAAAAANKVGVVFHLTISHSHDYAVAMVLAEKSPEGEED